MQKPFSAVRPCGAVFVRGQRWAAGAAGFIVKTEVPAAYRLFVQYAIIEQKALEGLFRIGDKARLHQRSLNFRRPPGCAKGDDDFRQRNFK